MALIAPGATLQTDPITDGIMSFMQQAQSPVDSDLGKQAGAESPQERFSSADDDVESGLEPDVASIERIYR